MRSFYSIRSIGIGLALIGASLMSVFLVSAPASAEVINPLDAGYHRTIRHAVDFAYVVFDVLPVAEAGRLDDRGGAGALTAVAELYPLKPEYAESYQTNGLNFIDVRRRC